MNLWRYVQYTDDGCVCYQCLACRETWEARTAPGYTQVDGTYHPTWKFCPYCGTAWDGVRSTDPTRCPSQQYGPRRCRIQDAIDSVRFDDRPRYGLIWVVEERGHQRRGSIEHSWYAVFTATGTAKAVLERLRDETTRLTRERGQPVTLRIRKLLPTEPRCQRHYDN